MAGTPGQDHTTCVSRFIKAPRDTLYRAFLDPDALVSWLPPRGMTGHIFAFDARAGGAFRLALTFTDANHSVRGKTSVHTDVVCGRFVQLVPDERIVWQVEFESNDPAFAGSMTIEWTLAEAPGGTEITVLCADAPAGVRPDDHAAGFRSTLENLAAFTE